MRIFSSPRPSAVGCFIKKKERERKTGSTPTYQHFTMLVVIRCCVAWTVSSINSVFYRNEKLLFLSLTPSACHIKPRTGSGHNSSFFFNDECMSFVKFIIAILVTGFEYLQSCKSVWYLWMRHNLQSFVDNKNHHPLNAFHVLFPLTLIFFCSVYY